MKKIILATVLLTALGLGFTGCLKDKGFNNGQYGINDPDTQDAGVGFALGAKTNTFGLDVSASPQTIVDMVFVNVFDGSPAPANVNVTLTNTSAARIAAYNAANNTNVLVLPTNLYSLPSNTLTIPAGAYNVTVPITVTNTTSLDPNASYGLAYTISSNDGGYTIADNFKTLLIIFSVKNQYDGKYLLRGQFYHPTQSPGFDAFSVAVEMHTTGPNKVKIYVPLFGGYYHPGLFGGVLNAFGLQEPEYTINQTTNAVTVQNAYPGAVTFYDMISAYPAGNNFNHRWDPATKTIYAAFGYSLGPGNTVNIGASRAFIDTLIRTGPR